MTLQKAIFDMDGTILDSTAMWRSAAAHVVTALGHSPKESIGRDTLARGMLEFAPFLKKDYDLPQPVEEIHAILEQRVQQYYTKEAENFLHAIRPLRKITMIKELHDLSSGETAVLSYLHFQKEA